MTAAAALLEQLGLHEAVAVLPAWLERASREEVSYHDFLQGLLEEEQTARANAETQRRLREAGFPFAATIEQFDFPSGPTSSARSCCATSTPVSSSKPGPWP